MRRWVGCGLLWAAGALASAQAPVDSEEILDRIKARMKENLTRLPDYVCLQTVERQRRRDSDNTFERLDTLRLEVTLLGNRELFAWRGASRFEEKELGEMVGSGALGTGTFSARARNVFLTGAPEYTSRGEVSLDGRRAVRFDYEVPGEKSSYRLRISNHQAVVGFRGSFWVDAETLDLMRLEVEAVDIPEGLGLAASRDVLDYARVPIGGADFLLPRSSELTLTGSRGNVSRNRTEFSGCRQYVGQANLRFEESGEPTPTAVKPAGKIELAARLVMEMTLDTEIAPETAAAGDPIQALLAAPLTQEDRILAPKGAVVTGRLVRVEKNALPFAHYVVALEFDTLQTAAGPTSFTATMESAGPAAGLLRQEKRLNPTFTRRRSPRMDILVREHPRGQGVLHWEAKQPRIRRGLRMKWETE